MMITGGGLYANQPFIDTIESQGLSLARAAKPTDHVRFFERRLTEDQKTADS